MNGQGTLGNTWPLFAEASPAFPADPVQTVTPFRPRTAELEALERDTDLPETTEQLEQLLSAEPGSYDSIAAVTASADGTGDPTAPVRLMT